MSEHVLAFQTSTNAQVFSFPIHEKCSLFLPEMLADLEVFRGHFSRQFAHPKGDRLRLLDPGGEITSQQLSLD